MSFNHKYPYEDYTELNLDWVIKCIKDLADRVAELEERVDELEGSDENAGIE